MLYYFCIETDEGRIFGSVDCLDFDQAFDVIFDHAQRREGGIAGIAKSQNELDEDLYCTDHDC